MELDISTLMDIFAPLLGIFIAGVLTWFVKSYAAGQKTGELYTYVNMVVLAAQQYLDGKTGPEKFEWASEMLRQKFPNLTEEEIRVFIESAYNVIKNALSDEE